MKIHQLMDLLPEAKRVCKERGDIFDDWIKSSECPVGKTTAYKLLSVYGELGSKSSGTELAAEIQSYVHPGKGNYQDSGNYIVITRDEPPPPPQQGNSKAYTLNRLRRDHGELFEKVKAGELTANAAAIQAGFRKKPTPFEIVKAQMTQICVLRNFNHLPARPASPTIAVHNS